MGVPQDIDALIERIIALEQSVAALQESLTGVEVRTTDLEITDNVSGWKNWKEARG